MTVKRLALVHKYSGASGDTKPTGVPAGSTFFEENTGKGYEYTGAAWVKDVLTTQMEAILAAGEITILDIAGIGATDDTQETDPDAMDTTVVALLRGVLAQLIAANAKLDDVVTNTA